MKRVGNSWSAAVIYQIYPRSFKDSNADGIGDINGIIEKLDYLRDGGNDSLGIDAIWMSPIYKSPMIDFGYDVSDYCDIDPIFGNLGDFDKFVNEAHIRGIKILMDFIPSHTSISHPWFLESKSSKNSPKRDWYIWRDGKPNGRPPNNWLSVFGGSSWKLDKSTNQYYLHTFLAEQADLNWRNPKVKEAMLNVLRFWLKRGVDGFRIDAFDHMFKDSRFLDEPKNPKYIENIDDPFNSHLHIYTTSQPELYGMIKDFSRVLKEYGEKFMITESYVDTPALIKLYKAGDILHAPFNFQFIELPWNAGVYKKFVDEFDSSIGSHYLPTYVLGNHDRSRVASRLGHRGARIAAMLQLTLRGMPTIYYGDEIGMENGLIPRSKVHDPFEKNVHGKGLGRDPERTPMQWSSKKNAGFSNVEPWLPVANSYTKYNVADEQKDPLSMLSLYKQLIRLRKSRKALLFGTYSSLNLQNKDVFAYLRTYNGERLLTLLNFSSRGQHVEINTNKHAKILCNTYMDKEIGIKIDLMSCILRPHEGYLLEY